jgi:hypothetical protein
MKICKETYSHTTIPELSFTSFILMGFPSYHFISLLNAIDGNVTSESCQQFCFVFVKSRAVSLLRYELSWHKFRGFPHSLWSHFGNVPFPSASFPVHHSQSSLSSKLYTHSFTKVFTPLHTTQSTSISRWCPSITESSLRGTVARLVTEQIHCCTVGNCFSVYWVIWMIRCILTYFE